MQNAYKSITDMKVIDYAILRSVVMWERGFSLYSEPIVALITDLYSKVPNDKMPAMVEYIKNYINTNLSQYIMVMNNVCVPTEEGKMKYIEISSSLTVMGINTDAKRWAKRDIEDFFIMSGVL